MKKDFFITYHHDDELAARWIADILLKVPFSLFMESWDFLPGGSPLEKIDHMLTRSCSVAVLVSERWLQAGVEPGSWQPVAHKYLGPSIPALLLLRIDSCEVTQVLGAVAYTNLYGIKAGEAANRLLKAAGAAAPDEGKKETLPISPVTGPGILNTRKKELDLLLTQTVKHHYHMTLDLETEVEKVVDVKDEKTGRIKKRTQWVWEAVPLERVLTDGYHYLLVNPSGMGKTTFLTFAAGVMLDRTKDSPFVPLLTTCIAINQRSGSIEDFIASQVDTLYKNKQTDVVNEDWENLCILIDALDQARDVDEIVSSLLLPNRYTHYKKAKIILSSRQNTADKVKEGFRKIRLKLPVDDEVRLYMGEENYTKLEGHIKASRELITVPVLLEMLKTITAKGEDATVLENRADLYTKFTKILVGEERNKPRFWQDPPAVHHFIDNELVQTLEKIAFFSLAENNILEIDKETLVIYCGSLEKKEALLNIGILLELFEDREQKMVFRHQSFQAYFAARYMYYRRPNLLKQITKDIRFFYSDVWYEVIRFFVGLEKNPKKVEGIINSVLNNDANVIKKTIRWCKRQFKIYHLADALRLIFAFFLVSETHMIIEKTEVIYKKLNLLLINNRKYLTFCTSNIDKLNPGNDLEHKSLFESLSRLLKDNNQSVFNAAAEALKKISTTKDIPHLENLLKDESKSVRRAAIDTLEKLGTSNNIHLIEALLMDKDEFVRHSAINTLGKIGTNREISILISLLRDKNEDIRTVASEVLVNIGTKIDISLLKSLLRDGDSNIRRTAVEILGKTGTASDIPLLESLLKDEALTVRSASIKSLGDIGTSVHIPLLEPLLRDKNDDIRSVSASALGKIGTDRDILLLKPLLSDLNDNVRLSAIKAFGKIGKSTDILTIEPLLRDEIIEVRNAAVEALGKIDTGKVISLIKPLLKDKNDRVRFTAAEALGKFGTAEHIPLLEPLLKDVNVSIRRAVAVTLGKIGTSNDVHLLKPLLRDKNQVVRNATAVALGNIGTFKHIKFLKPLLSYWYYGINKISFKDLFIPGWGIKNRLKKNVFLCDEDDFSHRAAAEVLGKIGSSKHVRFLKPLMKDKNVYVCKAGAEALGKIGTPKHILLLEPLLFHLNSDVQKAAARSIEQIYRGSNPKLRIGRIQKKGEEKKSLIIKLPSLKSLHILHISDIHYSTENDHSIKHIFHEFFNDIKKWQEEHHHEPIHAICITGDIAFSGQKDEYASIHERINEILKATGCPKYNLFLIPGNHDVHEYNNFSEECQQIMDEALKDDTYIDRILSDFEKYRPFHDKFTHYYRYVETCGFNNSHTEICNGKPKPWYSRRLKDFPVRIIGLNSALFCLKPYSDRDKIRMGKRQFEEAYFHEKPLGKEDQELVLLLTHHPADWLHETEKYEYEAMMDRYKVVHLHGHIHRLKTELRSTDSGSTYMLIGTGSIYGEKGTKDINTYHIMTLDFEKQDIHIWGRRWEPGYGFWTVFADNTRNVFPFPGKYEEKRM